MGNIFFLPTALATECGITDERDANGRFSLVILSVKKLPMGSESYTDGLYPLIKL